MDKRIERNEKFSAGRFITLKIPIFVQVENFDKGDNFFAKLMFEQFLGKGGFDWKAI